MPTIPSFKIGARSPTPAKRMIGVLAAILALVIPLLMNAPLAHAANLLGTAVNYPAGNGPHGVAVADLNGDGYMDLAVANQYSGDVSVLLGNGDGTFGARVNYPVGGATFEVVAGDLDGDGHLDLVTASWGPNTVSVLLGNGDGTFATGTSFPSGGSYPRGVALGDLDRDGDLDLAITNNLSDTVTVFLNHGDGTFGAFTSYPVANGPLFVVVEDLNNDGKQDLAVNNYGWEFGQGAPAGGGVSVLLGNGDGTFAPATNFGAPDQLPYTIAAADLNADGNMDLMTPDSGTQTVSVYLGHGDGTFATAIQWPTGSGQPCGVAVGDLNGDGHLDLAVADTTGLTVSVLLGHGDGTFASAEHFPVGAWARHVALGDLDGDGDLDLVTTEETSDEVAVLLNTWDRPSNSAPEVSADSAIVAVSEGSAASNTGTFSDPDGDAVTLSASVGTVSASGSGTWTWSYTPTDGPTDTQTVTITASDDDLSGAATFALEVSNVAPTITSLTSSASTVLTGQPVTFVGEATDPSAPDTVAGFSWSFNSGAYGTSNSFTTQYDTCGTNEVTALAMDKDSGVSSPFTSSAVVAIDSAFLPPLKPGVFNKVQGGQVVPVKINAGCDGVMASGLQPSIQLLAGDVDPSTDPGDGTNNVTTESVSSADTTGIMRAADGQYIYNLRVPASKPGTKYTIRVRPTGSAAGGAMYIVIQVR